MSRHMIVVLLAALLALLLALATLPYLALAGPAPALAPDGSAVAVARKALDAGAALFNAKDAPKIAATYAEDAVLTLVGQDAATHEIKREVKNGRSAIESYYQTVFKPGTTFHARNTVEYARWAGPDLLLITGHFVLDTTSPAPLSLPFVQVRQRHGDAWRILSIEVFVVGEKS